MESKSDNFVDKLKKSTVFKVTSGYAILAFATVQIASLISNSFGFNQEFMQNIIIVFLVILPFIAITAWAASSKFSTVKILGIVFAVLFTGYGGGSYVWVNNFILPDLKKALEEDNYVAAWDQVNRLNSFAPFLYNSENVDSEISLPVSMNVSEPGVQISWKPYTVEKDYEWRYIGTTPLNEFALPKGVINLKLEKKG